MPKPAKLALLAVCDQDLSGVRRIKGVSRIAIKKHMTAHMDKEPGNKMCRNAIQKCLDDGFLVKEEGGVKLKLTLKGRAKLAFLGRAPKRLL